MRGRLTPPEGKPQPFKAALLVDGREQDAPALGEGNRTLSGRARLQPGANRIEVRLSNEWGESATVERQLTFQRPPRVEEIEEPAPDRGPFFNIVARVESPAEMVPQRAEVNGREWPADALRVEKVAGKEGQWRVIASKVPLEPGENLVRLVVGNKDGPSAPATRKVRWEPPAPPANVPALDEHPVGKSVSLRVQLEQHRANPTCASCHSRMDPLGFALEHFAIDWEQRRAVCPHGHASAQWVPRVDNRGNDSILCPRAELRVLTQCVETARSRERSPGMRCPILRRDRKRLGGF